MKRLVLFGLSLCLLMVTTTQANPMYQVYALQEQQAVQFIKESGYSELAPDTLITQAYYDGAKFSTAQTSSVFLPDADLDALTRSILIFEEYENRLPHTRYLIHYSTETDPDFPHIQQSYIELTRYNLGPERQADLLQYVADAALPPLEEFGIGPHVSWRVVLGATQGMQADLRYVSRKEISTQAAQQSACLGQPCLQLEPTDLTTATQSMSPQAFVAAAYQEQSDLGIARAARVAQELMLGVAPEPLEPLPFQVNQPQFVLLLSMNTAGQEANSLGQIQQKIVLDDVIAEIQLIRQEVAGVPAQFFQKTISR